METPAYSIPIYPDGNREKPHRLAFYTKKEKEEHIQKENKFCKKALQEYHKALFNNNRDAEQKLLDLRRVRFAVNEGFTPARLRGTLWVKQETLLPPTVA